MSLRWTSCLHMSHIPAVAWARDKVSDQAWPMANWEGCNERYVTSFEQKRDISCIEMCDFVNRDVSFRRRGAQPFARFPGMARQARYQRVQDQRTSILNTSRGREAAPGLNAKGRGPAGKEITGQQTTRRRSMDWVVCNWQRFKFQVSIRTNERVATKTEGGRRRWMGHMHCTGCARSMQVPVGWTPTSSRWSVGGTEDLEKKRGGGQPEE
jgi:hypothetical protein